jgi:hypothetical protein
MMELVQITSQYSNAVLIAILPYIAEFCQNLNLPITTPITPIQVEYFKCDPRKDHIGGLCVLTNHYQFSFMEGRVCVFRSPQSFFSLQDPERLPQFYGKVTIKEKEALRIAHETIKNLGYKDSMFHAGKPPQITPPENVGNNYIPRYRFKWIEDTGSKPKTPTLLDMEVNASNGRVEMIQMVSAETHRPSPKVDVQPPVVKSSPPKSDMPPPSSKIIWPSKEFKLAFLNAILPQITEFAPKARLAVKMPVTTNDVDFSKFTCVIDQGNVAVQLYLNNGDRFNYEHGHVEAFYGHDAFDKFPNMGNIDDFLGRINMSTNEAITLTKEVLAKFGYKKKMNLGFGIPKYIPNKDFTRYFVHYHRPEDNEYIAMFEVDLEHRNVKGICLSDPSFWRDPPKVNVPVTGEGKKDGE